MSILTVSAVYSAIVCLFSAAADAGPRSAGRVGVLCGAAAAVLLFSAGQPAALCGAAALLCAVSQMLLALPFRAFSFVWCEKGSGAWWQIWAAEQVAQTVCAFFLFAFLFDIL